MNSSLVIFLSISLGSVFCSPTEDCNTLHLKTGATWLDMDWSLFCGLTDTTSVQAYTIYITDMTSFTFNETLTYYCPMMNCSIHMMGLHPCITYQADLQLEMLNGSSYTYLPSTARTEEVRPGKPRHIRIEEATPTSLTISWSPPLDSICVHSYLTCIHLLYSST